MEKEDQKDMAKRIKIHRKKLNYTQVQFAEFLGISTNSYMKIENASQKPSLDTLINISKHLDLSMDYIVFGMEDEKTKEKSDTELIHSLLEYADEDKLLYTSELLAKIAKIKDS